jgi:hypothetical protein
VAVLRRVRLLALHQAGLVAAVSGMVAMVAMVAVAVVAVMSVRVFLGHARNKGGGRRRRGGAT